MARSPRWPACRGVPALSAASFSASPRQPRSRGTAAATPRRPRLVGRVLQRLPPATKIPWHRVVNPKGEVSYTLSRNGGDIVQRGLLEKEGIKFDASNRLDLERCRWRD